MDLNEYQELASRTAIHPGKGEWLGLAYCGLKLNGEAGEIAEHVGKALRDDGGAITPERRLLLLFELGDVLWYVARMAALIGYELDDVAQANIKKLMDRAERGTLQGSGDKR
jgi:NTP pyrophosphatase (non-canonical NTP hydrolase)